MKIKVKDKGYVTDVSRGSKGEAQVGTTGWEIWEITFDKPSENSKTERE